MPCGAPMYRMSGERMPGAIASAMAASTFKSADVKSENRVSLAIGLGCMSGIKSNRPD